MGSHNELASQQQLSKKFKSNLGGHNSIFQKQKCERIQKMSKLLNYKNKLEVLRQNEQFEAQLEADNCVSQCFKEEMASKQNQDLEDNMLKLNTKSKMSKYTNKRMTDSLAHSDSSSDHGEDPDPNAIEIYQPRHSKAFLRKATESEKLTAVNIVSKNGYLFKHRTKTPMPRFTGSTHDIYQPDKLQTDHTIEAKQPIKTQVKPRFYSRHKHFEKMPKFDMN